MSDRETVASGSDEHNPGETPMTSTTRRSVLAAGAAGISAAALSTSVAGNPGEKGPYLTGSRSSNTGVYTSASDPPDQLLSCEPNDEIGFDELNTVVHSRGEHPTYIYYYDGFREDADRVSAHLTLAQNHVHKYLRPPDAHESIIVLYPENEYSEPVSCYDGWRFSLPAEGQPGVSEYASQLLAPSANPAVEDGSVDELNEAVLEQAITHVWRVAAHHRDSIEQARVADIQPVQSERLHPAWFRFGVVGYLNMTMSSDSSPYGYNPLVSARPGEWAETVNISQLNWDAVNSKTDGTVTSAGAIVVEYIVEEWNWKTVLDTYFGTAGFSAQIQSTLGVTREKFDQGLEEYVNRVYGSTEGATGGGSSSGFNSDALPDPDWLPRSLPSGVDGALPVDVDNPIVPAVAATITSVSGGVGAYTLLSLIGSDSDGDSDTTATGVESSDDGDTGADDNPAPDESETGDADSHADSSTEDESSGAADETEPPHTQIRPRPVELDDDVALSEPIDEVELTVLDEETEPTDSSEQTESVDEDGNGNGDSDSNTDTDSDADENSDTDSNRDEDDYVDLGGLIDEPDPSKPDTESDPGEPDTKPNHTEPLPDPDSTESDTEAEPAESHTDPDSSGGGATEPETLSLLEVDGIGPAYKQRLEDAGIESVSQLTDHEVGVIAGATEIAEQKVSKFVTLAEEMAEDGANRTQQ